MPHFVTEMCTPVHIFCYKMRHCGIFICALWDLWRGYSRSHCTRVEIFFKDGHRQLLYVPNIWLFLKISWHGKLSALLALCEGNPSVTSDIPRWNMHCNTAMYQQLQCTDTLRVIRLFWHIAYIYSYIDMLYICVHFTYYWSTIVNVNVYIAELFHN